MNLQKIVTTLFIFICILSVSYSADDSAPVENPSSASALPKEGTPSPKKLPELFEKCNTIFSTYIDENGNANYSTLRRKRNELNEAVRLIEDITPIQYLAWDENHQKAFLINAHNIFTLKLIVDNYPIQPVWFLFHFPSSSIKQIENGRGREKVFFDIINREYTLYEIEHELLLGGFEEDSEDAFDLLNTKFGDLRVIFALSYASKSSAYLRNEAYYPDKLDEQLDDQVRRFLASDRGMKIDKSKKEVYLSGIFQWYKSYFLASKYSKIKKFRDQPENIQAYLNFIYKYAEPDIARYLENSEYSAKKTLSYDWQLNDTLN